MPCLLAPVMRTVRLWIEGAKADATARAVVLRPKVGCVVVVVVDVMVVWTREGDRLCAGTRGFVKAERWARGGDEFCSELARDQE